MIQKITNLRIRNFWSLRNRPQSYHFISSAAAHSHAFCNSSLWQLKQEGYRISVKFWRQNWVFHSRQKWRFSATQLGGCRAGSAASGWLSSLGRKKERSWRTDKGFRVPAKSDVWCVRSLNDSCRSTTRGVISDAYKLPRTPPCFAGSIFYRKTVRSCRGSHNAGL